jgi:RimJ/RimL family protein N-acetyltransferase
MINFEFREDYILEDESVILRPVTARDYDNLLPYALHEPEIWKYSLVQAGGKDGLRNYLELALAGRLENREYPFIVTDKKTGSYAGSTRFYDIQLNQKCLQLGYTWYGKDFQGTGLNKHCKFLLLQFAFEQMGMERVEFRADNRNEKSIAAMKSIGCTAEGVLRSNGFTAEGTRRDSIVLSILKEEWLGHVKENLQKKLI